MEFRKEKTEIVYDDGETTTTIQTANCDKNEIYDPFSGFCRLIFCKQGYTLTSNGYFNQKICCDVLLTSIKELH